MCSLNENFSSNHKLGSHISFTGFNWILSSVLGAGLTHYYPMVIIIINAIDSLYDLLTQQSSNGNHLSFLNFQIFDV